MNKCGKNLRYTVNTAAVCVSMRKYQQLKEAGGWKANYEKNTRRRCSRPFRVILRYDHLLLLRPAILLRISYFE